MKYILTVLLATAVFRKGEGDCAKAGVRVSTPALQSLGISCSSSGKMVAHAHGELPSPRLLLADVPKRGMRAAEGR